MNNKQEILPAVAAIIFNQQGEVLLQRRKDVNQWGLISGHVEFGESITDAILREVREETDNEGSISRFIGIYSAPASQTYYYNNRTVQYVTSYFEVNLRGAIAPGFCNEETAELRYFAPDALPKTMAQVNQYWLQDALDRNAGPFMR